MAETTTTSEENILAGDQTSSFDSIAEQINEFLKERQEEFKDYYTEWYTAQSEYLADAAANHIAGKLDQRAAYLEAAEAYVAAKSAEDEDFSDNAKASLAEEFSKKTTYINAMQENYSNWIAEQNARIDAMQEAYGSRYPDEVNEAIDAMQELMTSSVAKIQAGIDALQEKVSAKWDEIKDGSITEITASIRETCTEWSENVQSALSEIKTPELSEQALIVAAVWPEMANNVFKNVLTAQIVSTLGLA